MIFIFVHFRIQIKKRWKLTADFPVQEVKSLSYQFTAEKPNWPQFPAQPIRIHDPSFSSSPPADLEFSPSAQQPFPKSSVKPCFWLDECNLSSLLKPADVWRLHIFLSVFLWFSSSFVFAPMFNLLPSDRPLTCRKLPVSSSFSRLGEWRRGGPIRMLITCSLLCRVPSWLC